MGSLVSVVLLPLLIDSTVWIDIDADLRIILDKIPLTERLSAFGELQYGPETNNRSGKRGALMINKWLSLVGQNYCEF